MIIITYAQNKQQLHRSPIIHSSDPNAVRVTEAPEQNTNSARFITTYF